MKNFTSVVKNANPFLKAFLTIVLSLLLFAQNGVGQGNIQSGSSYTQNFDGIGTTATASLPTGWKVEAITTVRSVTTAYSSVAGTATGCCARSS